MEKIYIKYNEVKIKLNALTCDSELKGILLC